MAIRALHHPSMGMVPIRAVVVAAPANTIPVATAQSMVVPQPVLPLNTGKAAVPLAPPSIKMGQAQALLNTVMAITLPPLRQSTRTEVVVAVTNTLPAHLPNPAVHLLTETRTRMARATAVVVAGVKREALLRVVNTAVALHLASIRMAVVVVHPSTVMDIAAAAAANMGKKTNIAVVVGIKTSTAQAPPAVAKIKNVARIAAAVVIRIRTDTSLPLLPHLNIEVMKRNHLLHPLETRKTDTHLHLPKKRLGSLS